MAATGGPDGLQTLTDLSLENLERGPKLGAIARAEMAKRAADTGVRGTYTAAAAMTAETMAALSLTWDDLQQRHPEYRGAFWEECRALYAGGERLLGNPNVFGRLFPKNLFEDPQVYGERSKRSHYFPYPGTILDHLVAGLSSDPLRVSFAIEGEDGKVKLSDDAKWWQQWLGDVSASAEQAEGFADVETAADEEQEGGVSAHEFMLEVAREAEQVRTAWILCDLPPLMDAEGEPSSALDEERAGLRDPYLCLVPAEQVIDWNEDERKELEWVLTCSERRVRDTLRSRRKYIEQTYTLWTRVDYVRYVVQFDPNDPPQPGAVLKPTALGPHSFGAVPFVRFTLPEGMWGMGKMHSIAREHLNKRCAMAWAEYKSLFPMLYEYLGVEDANGMPIAQAQQDAGRAINQVRAIGWTQVRGKDDRAEFVGPAADAFTSARESCNDLMREMHRVMFSMGLSANMDAAALSRSGDSKAEDKAATEVLLDALGMLIRIGWRRVVGLVARGRGEPAPAHSVSGLDHFDAQGVVDAINEAVLLEAVPVKSPTFAELYYSRLYCKILGDATTQAQREKIREEVRTQVSAEQMLAEQAQAAQGQPGGAGGADDPGDDGGDNPAPEPARPMYKSKRPPVR